MNHSIPQGKTTIELLFVCLFVCFVLFLFFETGFLSVALAVLELTLQTRLAWNSEIHLPLPAKCWDYRRAPPSCNRTAQLQ